MAEGEQGFEEGRLDLRPEAGRDGKDALRRSFYAFDDPPEAAVFSVLFELMGELDKSKV